MWSNSLPIDPSLPFRTAILWIDRSDNLPRKLEIQEKTGTNRTLVLSGVDDQPAPAPECLHLQCAVRASGLSSSSAGAVQ